MSNITYVSYNIVKVPTLLKCPLNLSDKNYTYFFEF